MKEIEIKFKAGDSVQITEWGCNNTNAPEHTKSIDKGDTIYTVARVETQGVYTACEGEYYTLILNTGDPVWANCCTKVEAKDMFPIC